MSEVDNRNMKLTKRNVIDANVIVLKMSLCNMSCRIEAHRCDFIFHFKALITISLKLQQISRQPQCR